VKQLDAEHDQLRQLRLELSTANTERHEMFEKGLDHDEKNWEHELPVGVHEQERPLECRVEGCEHRLDDDNARLPWTQHLYFRDSSASMHMSTSSTEKRPPVSAKTNGIGNAHDEARLIRKPMYPMLVPATMPNDSRRENWMPGMSVFTWAMTLMVIKTRHSVWRIHHT